MLNIMLHLFRYTTRLEVLLVTRHLSRITKSYETLRTTRRFTKHYEIGGEEVCKLIESLESLGLKYHIEGDIVTIQRRLGLSHQSLHDDMIATLGDVAKCGIHNCAFGYETLTLRIESDCTIKKCSK